MVWVLGFLELPIGSIVVPFLWFVFIRSKKVVPKRNYCGAHGYRVEGYRTVIS